MSKNISKFARPVFLRPVFRLNKIYLEILKDEFKILTGRTFSRTKWRENYQCSRL
jgi:hypothetical protein